MLESISIVIPVYNGAATVGAVVRRVLQVLRGAQRRMEIILVNDGSRDDSWATIQALAQEYPEVAGIDLTRNYGQHNALLCGIRLAAQGRSSDFEQDRRFDALVGGDELARRLEALRRR